MVEREATAPARSGSSDTQEESDDVQTPEPVVITPFEQDPLLQHSKGLTADADRRSPTAIERGWMAATIQHYARDLRQARKDLIEARRKLDDSRDKESELDKIVGILRERLRQYARVRHFSQAGTSLGSALAGFGIGNLFFEPIVLPLLLIVVGVATVIFAWLASPKGDEG